jgi:hypothetical protein
MMNYSPPSLGLGGKIGLGLVGAAGGAIALPYLADRAYEAATGEDAERQKALQLLNMYLTPEDVASVDRRIEMAEGGQMQPQQDPRMERGMRPLSPQEQQVQAQMQMQEARRQQAMQSKAQQDMIRAQMMQQQGYQ